MRCTDVLNVFKHPILNKNGPDERNNRTNNLNGKHNAGRNLHVMSKLQVSSKVDGLSSCNYYNCLEDGIGNRMSWKHITSNQFTHHPCGKYLIGYGCKHRKWDGK